MAAWRESCKETSLSLWMCALCVLLEYPEFLIVDLRMAESPGDRMRRDMMKIVVGIEKSGYLRSLDMTLVLYSYSQFSIEICDENV